MAPATINAMNVSRVTATNFLPFDKVPPLLVMAGAERRASDERMKGLRHVRNVNMTAVLRPASGNRQKWARTGAHAVGPSRCSRDATSSGGRDLDGRGRAAG